MSIADADQSCSRAKASEFRLIKASRCTACTIVVLHIFFCTVYSLSIQCTCAVLFIYYLLQRPKLCSLLSHGSSSACRKLARWHLALQQQAGIRSSRSVCRLAAGAETKQKSWACASVPRLGSNPDPAQLPSRTKPTAGSASSVPGNKV